MVADRNTGPLARHSRHHPRAMTTTASRQYLKFVKTRFPDKTDASILLEPNTAL